MASVRRALLAMIGEMHHEDYEGPRTQVTLSWHFEAAPAAVFDAWIKPETASKWLFATESSRSLCELDARSGGSYEITRIQDGQRYVAVGEYLQVDPPRRLTFTFGMPQFAADVDTVKVELTPADGGTELSFTQDGLRPGFEEATLAGWRGMFVLLETALAGRAG